MVMKNLSLRTALTNLLVPQDGNLNTTDFVFLLNIQVTVASDFVCLSSCLRIVSFLNLFPYIV